jgi:Ni2+-binding GTPase involved in maturation of urease and hydrogenase
MTNVIIWGPVRSGRTWLAKRVREEFGKKVGAVLVVDELLINEDAKFKLHKEFVMVCMGFAAITPEEEFKREDNKDTLERLEKLVEASKHVKATAEKLGIKFFDVSFNRGHDANVEILEYIKKEL